MYLQTGDYLPSLATSGEHYASPGEGVGNDSARIAASLYHSSALCSSAGAVSQEHVQPQQEQHVAENSPTQSAKQEQTDWSPLTPPQTQL